MEDKAAPRDAKAKGSDPTNSQAVRSRPRRRNEDAKHDLRQLLLALRAADRGDFGVRLFPSTQGGVMDEIVDAFNHVIARNALLASEMERVERVVGREGRMTERVALGPDIAGQWQTSMSAINALIGDLVQ